MRDGGYYNNWDFSQELISDYLLAMDALQIDFIEIGFRTLNNDEFKGGCAFSTDSFINSLVIPHALKNKIGVMVNGSELIVPADSNKTSQDIYMEEVLERLFSPQKKSPVSLVRIACHVKDFETCLSAANWLKNNGYLVGFNLMQVAECPIEELTRLAELANKCPIDVLYFADSMGSLTPDKTSQIIKAFQSGWKGELGIHTHDNMGQAIANSTQAINDGVVWLDSTVTGMGRGAGNAQTEYLVLIAESKRQIKPNLTKLLELISNDFKPLQNHFGWGANMYYYLAGQYNIHPSYVQEMLSDKSYSDEDILAVIDHLKVEGARKFNWHTLNTATHFYSEEVNGTWSPIDGIKGRDVLILGGGPSVSKYKDVIERYVRVKKPFVIALNTQRGITNDLIDIRVACHPVRLSADSREHLNLPQQLVTPVSMLPEDVKKELANKELLDFGVKVQPGEFKFSDKSCVLPCSLVLAYALAIANSGQAANIFLTGLDGYDADDTRRKEVNEMFHLYNKNRNTTDICSITPTRYEIAVQSIYGLEK